MNLSSLQVALFCAFFSVFTLAAQDSLRTSPFHKFLTEKGIKTTLSTAGVCYQFSNEGSGNLPKTGDYIKMHYTAYLLDSTIFEQTQPDNPFMFQVGYHQVIEGLDKGVMLFKGGSEGDLFIPPSLGFGSVPMDAVPANATLRYHIKDISILDAKAYDAHMKEVEARERKAFVARQDSQFMIDKRLINDYSISHKLKTKRTDSGLSYAVTKEGKGALAKFGDTLSVQYEGFLLNDTLFDKNLDKNGYTFILGKNVVIKGLDEGFTFFNTGAEGWILLPSRLGYGASPLVHTKGELPGNSALVFKVKVLGIRPKK